MNVLIFNEERQHLCELLHCDYAVSIYGSSVSHSTNHSKASSAAAKRAEAAADLAAKEIECEEKKTKGKDTEFRGATEDES